MSRRESLVETLYIDTELSSGDSNRMTTKTHQEVNNNEIDELSKDLQMGCIVDAIKKPNICVENIVHEYESDSEGQPATVIDNNAEDGYSDEFEEDKSEEDAVKEGVLIKEEIRNDITSPDCLKLRKSHSSTSTNKPPQSLMSGRSTTTSYGSLNVPGHHRRINMSFTNDRLREIERQNHILLNKIINVRNTKSAIPSRTQPGPVIKPVCSAAVLRKKEQRKIDYENMILLKKLQRAKSSSASVRR